jgi:hypothetical protein
MVIIPPRHPALPAGPTQQFNCPLCRYVSVEQFPTFLTVTPGDDPNPVPYPHELGTETSRPNRTRFSPPTRMDLSSAKDTAESARRAGPSVAPLSRLCCVSSAVGRPWELLAGRYSKGWDAGHGAGPCSPAPRSEVLVRSDGGSKRRANKTKIAGRSYGVALTLR